MAKDKLLWSAAGLGAVVLLAALFLPDWRTEPPTVSESAPDFHFTWNGQTRPAPDFRFTWDGQARQLSELRGRVVVLNFWATWCPPCVEEMPSLERLHRKLSDRGVVVLGVSVDTDAAAYERFLRENDITFPNYRDPKGEIARRYGTWMFPETYIINRDGHVDRKIVGPHEWDNPEIFFYLTQLAGS